VNHWIIQCPDEEFDDVSAYRLEIDGGCLIFRNSDGEITLAYAAGTWTSVVEGAES
jgi:hypothetical protein